MQAKTLIRLLETVVFGRESPNLLKGNTALSVACNLLTGYIGHA